MRASMTAGSQTQSLQCGSGRLVPETDQEVRTKDSGAREWGDSSLPALARFGLSTRNPDCGVPCARGMRRRLRERDWRHHRRDQGRAAFGGIAARRFYPPPYQPLSNSSSAFRGRSLRGQAKQRPV